VYCSGSTVFLRNLVIFDVEMIALEAQIVEVLPPPAK
jgi:hypothetical protein